MMCEVELLDLIPSKKAARGGVLAPQTKERKVPVFSSLSLLSSPQAWCFCTVLPELSVSVAPGICGCQLIICVLSVSTNQLGMKEEALVREAKEERCASGMLPPEYGKEAA